MRWESPFPAEIAFAQTDASALEGPDALGRASELRVELESLGDRAVERRRTEFVLGRTAAAIALEQLGAPKSAVPIGRNREPDWPSGVIGTITHTDGLALAAVGWRSDVGGLGLDVESVDRHFDGLLEMITDEDERSAFGSRLLTDPARAALELFTAKEALYKALFPTVQRFFGFESARARPSGAAIELELTEDLHAEHPAGRLYRVEIRWQGRFVLASIAIPAAP